MTQMRLDGAVARAIIAYAGPGLTSLTGLPDPLVPGTFAFRALFEEVKDGVVVGRQIDFMVVRAASLSRITQNDLIECEFTEWPPKSICL